MTTTTNTIHTVSHSGGEIIFWHGAYYARSLDNRYVGENAEFTDWNGAKRFNTEQGAKNVLTRVMKRETNPDVKPRQAGAEPPATAIAAKAAEVKPAIKASSKKLSKEEWASAQADLEMVRDKIRELSGRPCKKFWSQTFNLTKFCYAVGNIQRDAQLEQTYLFATELLEAVKSGGNLDSIIVRGVELARAGHFAA